jgi:hypothetical protein
MTSYISDASETYISALHHATKEEMAQVAQSPRRTPIDFLADCAEENLEVAHIIRKEAFKAPCLDGYSEHPNIESFESLTTALEASAKDLLAAIEAIGDAGLADDVECPDGEKIPAFRLVTRVANHMKYHDLYTGIKIHQ